MKVPLKTVAVATCGDCEFLKVAWGGDVGCRHPAVLRFGLAHAVREATDTPEWFVPLDFVELGRWSYDPADRDNDRLGSRRPQPHDACPIAGEQ